jgi:hypothetical protein
MDRPVFTDWTDHRDHPVVGKDALDLLVRKDLEVILARWGQKEWTVFREILDREDLLGRKEGLVLAVGRELRVHQVIKVKKESPDLSVFRVQTELEVILGLLDLKVREDFLEKREFP